MKQYSLPLLVKGNQYSNAGWNFLVRMNNPVFDLDDLKYGGFGGNDHVICVRHTKDKLIYSVATKKVKSYDGERSGGLAIGISVPKGYRLADPYGVLMRLYDKFLGEAMSVSDDGFHRFRHYDYEKAGAIFQDILNCELEECSGPYFEMNGISPAYLIAGDGGAAARILADTQYPEFKNLSMLVVLENSSMDLLSGYNVIRPDSLHKKYHIFINNTPRKDPVDISDESRLIELLLPAETYHEKRKVCFTVSQVRRGDFIGGNKNPEISINDDDRSIRIKWTQVPKIFKCRLTINGKSLSDPDNAFLSGNIVVRTGDRKIDLEADGSFVLRGKERVSLLTVSLNKALQDLYQMQSPGNFVLDEDGITEIVNCQVIKIQQKEHSRGVNEDISRSKINDSQKVRQMECSNGSNGDMKRQKTDDEKQRNEDVIRVKITCGPNLKSEILTVAVYDGRKNDILYREKLRLSPLSAGGSEGVIYIDPKSPVWTDSGKAELYLTCDDGRSAVDDVRKSSPTIKLKTCDLSGHGKGDSRPPPQMSVKRILLYSLSYLCALIVGLAIGFLLLGNLRDYVVGDKASEYCQSAAYKENLDAILTGSFEFAKLDTLKEVIQDNKLREDDSLRMAYEVYYDIYHELAQNRELRAEDVEGLLQNKVYSKLWDTLTNVMRTNSIECISRNESGITIQFSNANDRSFPNDRSLSLSSLVEILKTSVGKDGSGQQEGMLNSAAAEPGRAEVDMTSEGDRDMDEATGINEQADDYIAELEGVAFEFNNLGQVRNFLQENKGRLDEATNNELQSRYDFYYKIAEIVKTREEEDIKQLETLTDDPMCTNAQREVLLTLTSRIKLNDKTYVYGEDDYSNNDTRKKAQIVRDRIRQNYINLSYPHINALKIGVEKAFKRSQYQSNEVFKALISE